MALYSVSLLILLVPIIMCNQNGSMDNSEQPKYINTECCTEKVLNQSPKYVKHLNDSSKFVECVGIGLGIEMDCLEGYLYVEDISACVQKPESSGRQMNASSEFDHSSENSTESESNSTYARRVRSIDLDVANLTEALNSTEDASTTTKVAFKRLVDVIEISYNQTYEMHNSTSTETKSD